MSSVELCAIAVVLALDAFAVSACSGCTIGRAAAIKPGQYVRMAGTFGLFQCFMPLIGWYVGGTLSGMIEAWDHWIAFALLSWVGIAMIRSSLTDSNEPAACALPQAVDSASSADANKAGQAGLADPTRGRTLLLLAFATSIDALAVGLSFSLLNMDIWGPAILIGLVCTVLSAVGLALGCSLSRAAHFGNRAAFVGGVVLVLIGCKILYEHGVAHSWLAVVM